MFNKYILMEDSTCPVCFSESPLLSFPCKHRYCAECTIRLIQHGHANCPNCRVEVFDKVQIANLVVERRVNIRPGSRQQSTEWSLTDVIVYSVFVFVGFSLVWLSTKFMVNTIQSVNLERFDFMSEISQPVIFVQRKTLHFIRQWENGSDPGYHLIAFIYQTVNSVICYCADVFATITSTLVLIILDFIGFTIGIVCDALTFSGTTSAFLPET